MSVLIDAVLAVALLMLLMATGYFMGHMGWLGQQEKAFLGKYLIMLAVPATCFTGLLNNLTLEMLLEFQTMVVGITATVVGTIVLAYIVGRFMPLPRQRKGTMIAMAGFSNALFIGYPIITQIYGDAAIPYLMIYYMGNALTFQTLGATFMRNAGEGGGEKFDLLATVKNLCKTPPFLGIFAGIFVLVTQIPVPNLFMSYANYLANTVSPLAIIYCGYVLYELGLKNLRLMPGHFTMLVIRLIISPVLGWCIATLFGIDGIARDVVTLVSGLPVVSQVTVFAGVYGADEEYAAAGACTSTILCCVTVPIIVVIMSLIG